MSWILTDSIQIPSGDISRVERRKDKVPSTTPLATFDWKNQKPIDSATIHNYKYYLVHKNGEEFELTKDDFISIRNQLNLLNERDIEFLHYIKEHLEFKPGTEAFDEVQRDFFNRPL